MFVLWEQLSTMTFNAMINIELIKTTGTDLDTENLKVTTGFILTQD